MPVFSLDDMVAKTLPFIFEGREWTATRLSQGGRGRMEMVIRRLVPNPLSVFKDTAKDMPAPVVAEMYREASRQYSFWPPIPESEIGQNLLLGNTEYQAELLYECLKKEHPISKDDAKRMVESMPWTGLCRVLSFALTGTMPGDEDDPKG